MTSGFALLQRLHFRVITQLGIQLSQLLLQCQTLLLDRFELLCGGQLLFKESLVLLLLKLQFGQFSERALLVLHRQFVQAKLQARQSEIAFVRVLECRGHSLGVQCKGVCAQRQHGPCQHLVQRCELFGWQMGSQLLVQTAALGPHFLA